MPTHVPYRAFPDGKGSSLYQAILNVRCSLPQLGASVSPSIECVIDSRATDCLFDATLADDLGIQLESGRMARMKAIGGLEDCWVHDLILYIPGGPVRISAGFKENLGLGGVLGFNGFFEHFVVNFDSPLKRYSLDRIHQA
jgi:hypothetical protein